MADPWAVVSVAPTQAQDPWAVAAVAPAKPAPSVLADAWSGFAGPFVKLGHDVAEDYRKTTAEGAAGPPKTVAETAHRFGEGIMQPVRMVGDALGIASAPAQAVVRPVARAVGNAVPLDAYSAPKVTMTGGKIGLDTGHPVYGDEKQALIEGGINTALAAAKPAGDPMAAALAAAPRPKPTMTGNPLKDIGVSTSIPQRMGGMAKATEDLAMRAPIVGPAISGARARQVEQLNRGIALKALEPIGVDLPKDIKPGFETVEFVDKELGKVYDKAAAMVPAVHLDEPLVAEFAKIGARKVDLAESEASHFDSIVNDRLKRLQSGDAPGEMVKKIHSELGELQAEAARKGQTTLSGMLGDTRKALMDLLGRASPEAAALIKSADAGWQTYSIMNDAAAAASNRGGVFLPGQLNTQVRSAGKALGANMTGKGKAPLQDIATAASQTIPDSFGNPGTANALGLGGMGVGLMTNPGPTLAAAGGLSAAATPYWMMGRKVMTSLPSAAEEVSAPAAPMASIPRVSMSSPAGVVGAGEVAGPWTRRRGDRTRDALPLSRTGR